MLNRPPSTVPALLVSCAFCFGAALPIEARADIYVVVSPANTERLLTRQEVVDLFLGRHRAFSGGETALPFDLPRDNPVRRAFYSGLTGMSPAQLGNYWRQLAVSGHTEPPEVLPDEAEVARMVRENPSGVGYVSLDREPVNQGLRIVFFLRTAQ
jgi:ABC-type phosphate transport system substrate-binding protein